MVVELTGGRFGTRSALVKSVLATALTRSQGLYFLLRVSPGKILDIRRVQRRRGSAI